MEQIKIRDGILWDESTAKAHLFYGEDLLILKSTQNKTSEQMHQLLIPEEETTRPLLTQIDHQIPNLWIVP